MRGRATRGEVVSLGTVNVDVLAYLARRLDAPSRVLERVGDDAFADRALAPLIAAGVDLRYTRRVEVPPVHVVDLTGAGDAFAGALAIRRARRSTAC